MVYVGGKNARVSLAVYDKRQEQLVKRRPLFAYLLGLKPSK